MPNTRKLGIAVILLAVLIGAASFVWLTSNSGTSVAPSTSGTPEWRTLVTSVNSSGGHFGFAGVVVNNVTCQAGEPNCSVGLQLSLPLAAGQASTYHANETVDAKVVYSPSQRTLYESSGTVLSVSSSTVVIRLQNGTFPSSVPSSWNPNVGDVINLTI